MFDNLTMEKFQEMETPFYYYDMELLQDTLKRVSDGSSRYGYKLHYALKANANPTILKAVSKFGIGGDCVSAGEITRALECGIPAEKIVYAGVGKADWEIELALEKEIFCLNCESIAEINVVNEIAEKMNKKADIAVRINPNVNATTHHYITTGLEENKFGIDRALLPNLIEEIKDMKNINLIGLHFHIGSQITNMNAFKNLCLRINEIQRDLDVYKLSLNHINVGGGLGIDYENPSFLAIPDFYSYFNIFHKFIELRDGQTLHFEPGRSIVANCGTLISKVLYIKEGVSKKFAIIDAGMTELIRPALYQAAHTIENLSAKEDSNETYDVVGPICESSDFFAKNIELPIIHRKDILAICSAGAYGESMQSNYNLRKTAKSYFTEI